MHGVQCRFIFLFQVYFEVIDGGLQSGPVNWIANQTSRNNSKILIKNSRPGQVVAAVVPAQKLVKCYWKDCDRNPQIIML